MLRLLLTGGHECWVDDYVVSEARRNLHAKGRDSLAVFDALLARLKIAPGQMPVKPGKEIGWLPEKDIPVLATAIRLRCDALITGDRTHFGPGYGKTFGGVAVHSPRSLAEFLFR